MNTRVRFESYVERLPDAPGCWLWTGALHSAGYGVLNLGGVVEYAHRISWLWNRSEIPEGHHVHHRCRVRACCNPAHLELLLGSDHMQEHADEHKAKMECAKGHSMADAYIRPDTGGRQCRTCRKLAWEAFDLRRRRLHAEKYGLKWGG